MEEKFQLLQYQNGDGYSPFHEWLFFRRFDSSMQARILTRLARLRIGNFSDCKSLGKGLCELRMHFGPGYRVYFGIHEKQLVVLLCGGNKATQSQDIKTARLFWDDYLKRSAS